MKKLVYVAGPYALPDPVENTHKAIKAADELIELGFIPVVPHLSLLWHIVSPKGADFWYAYDLEILRRCDALLRLPGESRGADGEVEFCQKWTCIPVFYSVDELQRFFRERR